MRDIIELVIGDITTQEVDALISPANNESLLNTDMASHIAVKAGKELSEACNRIGKVALGEAVVTPGGKLLAKHVIHAACLTYSQSMTEENLVLATRAALQRARELGLKTLAMPPLDDTGKGFPLKRCAELMISEVIRHSEKEVTLERVVFVLPDARVRRIFDECLRQT